MPDAEYQVFLDDLVSGKVAHRQLLPGIKVATLQAGTQAGLAIQIARETLQAGQLQRVLERRFTQSAAYAGCFVYLDARGALVIWHALPAQRNALDKTLGRMLSLANLESLATHASR